MSDDPKVILTWVGENGMTWVFVDETRDEDTYEDGVPGEDSTGHEQTDDGGPGPWSHLEGII